MMIRNSLSHTPPALLAFALLLCCTAMVRADTGLTLDFAGSDGGMTPTGNWAYDGASWYANGHGSHAEDYLTSPVFVVTSAGTVTGSVTHRFNFEYYSDGGQFRYRVNGGGWNTVSASLIGGVTYTDFNYGFYDPTHPTTYAYNNYGEYGFSNPSAGYGTPAFVTSSFTLGTGPLPYNTGGVAAVFSPGDQVEFQFRAVWDVGSQNADPNWQITSLSLNNLSVPEPASIALLAIGGLALLKRSRQ